MIKKLILITLVCLGLPSLMQAANVEDRLSALEEKINNTIIPQIQKQNEKLNKLADKLLSAEDKSGKTSTTMEEEEETEKPVKKQKAKTTKKPAAKRQKLSSEETY